MNKTIIININGIVFHIEEDAYEVLKSYMTEVKRHFAYSKDSIEIVTDIENRLAEMFNEILASQNKQVIVLADVEQITAQMGNASDFEVGESDTIDAERIKSSKTLYRDEDEKVIAGVCAGLAHYFDLEVKWIRIATLVATAISGIGLIPYIILWIVLPVARSRRDKLSMKGEPINLQNIKKSFEEEEENRSSLNHPAFQNRSSDPIRAIFEFIGRALKFVIKAIGLIIVAFGACALLGLIVALFMGLGFVDSIRLDFVPFSAINPEYQSAIFFSAFLILFIPLIALILFAIRVLLNRKVVSGYGSFSMLLLWLTGVAMGAYYGSKMAAEFRKEAKFEVTENLKSYPTIRLRLNSKMVFNRDDSLKYNIDSGDLKGDIVYGDNDFEDELKDFHLYIDKSDDGKISLTKEFSARGSSFEAALTAAQRIKYSVLQRDSLIEFDKYITLAGEGLYRAQRLNMHLKLPVNTKIIVEDNMFNRITDYHDFWDCRLEDSSVSEWIMTDEGLKCIRDLEKEKEELKNEDSALKDSADSI